MIDYYSKYKKYKSKYKSKSKSKSKYGGKCSDLEYNICGLNNGLCSNLGKKKATDNCICHRETERCVKKGTKAGLKEQVSRLKEGCQESRKSKSRIILNNVGKKRSEEVGIDKKKPNALEDLFKKRSIEVGIDKKKTNALEDLFKKRSIEVGIDKKKPNALEDLFKKRSIEVGIDKKKTVISGKVKKFEKQLKMGLPPLGVKKNIMEYLDTLDKDNPEREGLNRLIEEINKRIDRDSSGASETELLVNPLDNNYSGLLESRAIKLANKLKVKGRPDLGYKYDSIEDLYPQLIDDKIKKMYDRLSPESERELIKRLFNKLRSNSELRKTHRNILFSGENLKKIRKDIEIKSYSYSKKEDEYDTPPLSDDSFGEDGYDTCKQWLSSRATGPLTGAEDKIKKRVCGNCLVSKDKDLFRERYDPKSKFCLVCCSGN